MAITPEEARKITVDEEKEIENLEKKVDEIIRTRYTPSRDDIILDSNSFGRHGTRVFTQMKQMYEQAGWNIQYESHQRDGDFIRISPDRHYDKNFGLIVDAKAERRY